jgi:5'-deoxynucleotidase YfbR-like HD superfamily hydrolase
MYSDRRELSKYGLLEQRLLGGQVTRFHTRPDVGENQTVAEHTWRALVILNTLWPEASKNAWFYLLYHDITEAELGDLPATTTWKYPLLAKEYRKVESEYEKTLGIDSTFYPTYITDEDKSLCKMADMLELVLHCYGKIQKGNTLARPIFENGIAFLRNNFSKNPNFSPVEKVIQELENNERKL